ncbi:short-chain dehydrogenase [Rhodococcus opacus]|uniref:Short-chain dehydrogenase n=1 Tax=Rhodococcus opacus TaxID=37919 RepID=A0A2S8IYZ6_RHOOP|nr:short-chain dehydrogenase [Rhodococcus opacus]
MSAEKVRQFDGKVAVVTGGSRGLGREIVRSFAREGAAVVIASRKLDSCNSLAQEVSESYGVESFPFACNVSDWADCDALVEAVYSRFGRIDVLVNNAGLSPRYPSLEEVSEALFDKVINLNLRGPFRLGALIGTRMSKGEGGCIVNIGSIEAIRPGAAALPYAAAKSGLHTLTEGFAQAFGPNVRVNTVQPGAFLTDIADGWPDGMREEMESKVALRRVGDPKEIVGSVLYLASDASSYCTGAILRIDGGWV